ncbi:MAG: hypothetical protein AB7P17_15650 [Nitrospirales bacterium]|nr:hypothetical protein [Nitrospirales bacterium]
MWRGHFINFLFFLFILLNGGTQVLADPVSAPMVELPSAIHFLTPAGDDVEVGPGTYQVEVAENWLKLDSKGESWTGAILLDASQGPHEEGIAGPEVRTVSDPDHPELLHLALLMPGGRGLETMTTN